MSAEFFVFVTLWVVFVPANLYPVVYAFRPWWTTRQGQALMVKAIGNAILIDMILAYHTFGDFPGRQAMRVIGFSVFTLGMWFLLITLLTSRGARLYPPFAWDRIKARRQEQVRESESLDR